jgi:hypothetical protein
MHALTSVNFATGTAVVIRPDLLAVFRLRAWARGYLWSICELDLHEAVDVLQAEAERDGLVSRIGADGVQAILADAFHQFRLEDCCS